MHMSYVMAAMAAVLTTVFAVPHEQVGKRQLDGYLPKSPEPSSTASSALSNEATAAASSEEPKKTRVATKVKTVPYGTVASGTAPLYTASRGPYASDSTGIVGTGTAPLVTGTGIPTIAPGPYPNATSIYNIPSGVLPPQESSKYPESGKPYGSLHGTVPASEKTNSAAASSETGAPKVPSSGPGESNSPASKGPVAPSISTACAPAVTITITSASTVTVTATSGGSPSDSAAPTAGMPSAPYPVSNGTNPYYPTGTGTGKLYPTGVTGTAAADASSAVSSSSVSAAPLNPYKK